MKELDVYKSSVRLRELRNNRDISYAKLAEKVGVSAQVLKNYEAAALNHGVSTGKDKVNAIAGMSIKTLYRLANEFGVSADYLLGISDVPTTDTDLADTCKYTGLSQNAIEKAKNLNHKIVSFILESAEFQEIVRNFSNADRFNEILESDGSKIATSLIERMQRDESAELKQIPPIYSKAFQFVAENGIAATIKQQLSEEICRAFDLYAGGENNGKH